MRFIENLRALTCIRCYAGDRVRPGRILRGNTLASVDVQVAGDPDTKALKSNCQNFYQIDVRFHTNVAHRFHPMSVSIAPADPDRSLRAGAYRIAVSPGQ